MNNSYREISTDEVGSKAYNTMSLEVRVDVLDRKAYTHMHKHAEREGERERERGREREIESQGRVFAHSLTKAKQ